MVHSRRTMSFINQISRRSPCCRRLESSAAQFPSPLSLKRRMTRAAGSLVRKFNTVCSCPRGCCSRHSSRSMGGLLCGHDIGYARWGLRMHAIFSVGIALLFSALGMAFVHARRSNWRQIERLDAFLAERTLS